MNERIKELAEQAWVYQVQVLNEPDGSRTYTEKEKVFDKEKFAELIVAECIIRAEREWIRNGSDTEHNLAVSKVIDSIKEHFGVEE